MGQTNQFSRIWTEKNVKRRKEELDQKENAHANVFQDGKKEKVWMLMETKLSFVQW